MATQTTPHDHRGQLDTLLTQWEARWRTRRMVLVLPRVLLAAIGIALVVALVVALLRLLPPVTMFALVSGGILTIVVLVSLRLQMVGNRGVQAARQFDILFGLQERTSTAIELMDGRIQTAPELAHLQVADAYERAREIDPRKQIKIEVRWLEWVGVVMLGIVLALVLGFYALVTANAATAVSAGTQAAIAAAADDVRDITEEVATDSGLTDEERQTLLESLETSLNELGDEGATAEDSFVAMSELESDLSDLAESIRADVVADESALSAAAEALQNPTESDSAELGGEPQLGEALENWREEVVNLTPEQQAALQEQLTNAAQTLQTELPELAQDLQEAAAGLEVSDLQLTQEQMQQAQENLQALENALEQRSETAENLETSAQQAQEAAEQIAQSEAQTEQPEQSQQQGDEGMPQQSGEGENTSSQSDSQSAALTQGDNPGDAQVLVESEQGNPVSAQSQNQNDAATTASETGSGSGEGEAGSRQDTIGGQQQDPGTNTADGLGEIEYEAIYAPNLIDTETSGNLILNPDAGDSPSVEGNFQENPTGDVTVPYNQVFGSYQDAANRALANDYVPLGMQDVVRDYFTSLQPEGE